MNIGDRVRIIFGQGLRKEMFHARMIDNATAARAGYMHVWQEGVIVQIDDATQQLDQRIYHVHLDGDFRPDGAPDITVYEADSEGSLAEVVQVIVEKAISETEAANRVATRDASVRKTVDDQNAPILAEITKVETEIDAIKPVYQTIIVGARRTPEQEKAFFEMENLRYRLYNLRRTVIKTR